MKINPIFSSDAISQYKTGIVKRSDAVSSVHGQERLELSDDAMFYMRALKQAKESDDFRGDKVDNIKRRIESGTYEIDSRKVASRIVGDNLDITL